MKQILVITHSDLEAVQTTLNSLPFKNPPTAKLLMRATTDGIPDFIGSETLNIIGIHVTTKQLSRALSTLTDTYDASTVIAGKVDMFMPHIDGF